MQRAPGRLPTVRTALSHDIDQAAHPILLDELPRSWTRQKVDGSSDYGVDYFVEIVASFAPTGARFGIQLKGAEKPRQIGSAIHFSFPTKNLGTYLETEPLPIFVVIADVKKKTAHFLFLQRFADEHLRDEDWVDQDTVTVRVPIANRLADHQLLRRAVYEARDYMLAVRSDPTKTLAHRKAALERLDRRLLVRATATEEGEHYEIRAKEEGVRFGVSFAGLDAERRSLLRRGHLVPASHGEITFRDLPIVEHFARQMISFQIAAKLECTSTIEVERDGRVAELRNIPTTIIGGIDEIRITAAYTNAPIDISVTLTLLEPRTSNRAKAAVNVQHAIDERWFGQRIDELPHFDRLYAVGEVAAQPYRFRMVSHVPGGEDLEIPWNGPIGKPNKQLHEYDRAMAALRLARETCHLLGIFPIVPANVLVGGLGDVALIHALLTTGEYEGDGRAAVFRGHTPNWSDYLEKLSNAKKRLTDFEANGGANDCFWNFLGQKVNTPVGRLRLSKARCTVKRPPGGLIEVVAEGTPGSRFWVERAPGKSEPSK